MIAFFKRFFSSDKTNTTTLENELLTKKKELENVLKNLEETEKELKKVIDN